MEKWIDLRNYPGYQASSCGCVRSIDRTIATKVGARSVKGKVLAPCIHSKEHPYPYVQLRIDGVVRMRGVHVLVMEAFCGTRPDGMYVCHKDGDPSNNELENLYYGSPKDNQDDRKRHGTDASGEKHPMAKVTSADVREIIARLSRGEKQKDIGDFFGITQSAVSHIKRGKLWKGITCED